ncbi:acid-sensing ion channel 1-like [Actinia tenebrosa]|uniref:Acid-sensing ion channel 1-like n=1 Tax=Actinia tenebrosa TaxID=6105 RepID=A0A6P8I705_ACTTE|nr:acid-sensing ion channel 1-like [Actinia tenebrosa]
MSNNEEMLKEKPESLRELAHCTTLHGVRFLAEKNVFRRIFWAACLLGATSFCVLQVKEAVEYFRSRPFSTVITIKKETKISFPEVTICNMNSIHTGKYSRQVKRLFPNTTDREIEDDISYMSRSFRVNFDSTIKTGNVSQLNRIRVMLRNLTSISYGIDDILLPKELLSCTWAGKTCGAQNFKAFYDSKSFQCFTFQPSESEVGMAGISQGLQLKMNVGTDWYLPNSYEPFVGQKVVVHPSGEYPQLDPYALLIAPGIHTSCAVRRIQFINLGTPYQTNCGEEELKYVNRGKYSYSRVVCIEDCFYKILVDRCHCKTIEMSGDLPLCLDDVQTNCILALAENMTKVDSYLKCVNSCRESCKNSLYKTKLSTAKLNSKTMANDLDDICKLKNQRLSVCEEIQNKSHMEKIQFVR